MSKQLEEILRDNFCDFRKKPLYLIARKEVPVFARSVDLVEYNKKTNKLTAIEFKISDWKRALSQLENVEICFDYLVLCMPRPKTEKCAQNIKDACGSIGVGLYLWDRSNNSFSHECKEKCRREILSVQKTRIIDYLFEVEAQNE